MMTSNIPPRSDGYLPAALLIAACLGLPHPAQASKAQSILSGQLGVSLVHLSNQPRGTPSISMQDNLLEASWIRLQTEEQLPGHETIGIRLEVPVNLAQGANNGRLFNQSYLRYTDSAGDSLTLGRQFHVSVDRISDTLDAFEVTGSSVHVLPLALIGTNEFNDHAARVNHAWKYRYSRRSGLEWSLSAAAPGVDGGRSEAIEFAYGQDGWEVGGFALRFHSGPGQPAATQRTLGMGGNLRDRRLRYFGAAYLNQRIAEDPALPLKQNRLVHLGLSYQATPLTTLRLGAYLDNSRHLDGHPGQNGKKRTVVAAIQCTAGQHVHLFATAFRNTFSGGYTTEASNAELLPRAAAGAAINGIAAGMSFVF